MSLEPQKSEGFKFQLDSTTSALLERASGYIGLNKIKFVSESIRAKALAIIEECEKATSTENDGRMFPSLRENPAELTEAMKIASETPKVASVSQVNEQELLDHPLLQVSGLFAIGEPDWIDRHDEYLAEMYQEDNGNDE